MGKRLGPPLAAFIFTLGVLLIVSQPANAQQSTPTHVAIGDSLSYGLGATEPSQTGFVARVHAALESSERFQSSGIDLVNLSVPGATSPDLVQSGGQLDNALREIANGDVPIITVDIGGNDLLALAGADSPCLNDLQTDPCLDLLGDTLSSLQTNLGDVLEELRAAAPESSIVVVDLYNPFSGTGDIRELIADAGVQRLNGVIGATASDPDLRVRLASTFQHFQGRGLQWISSDGIHPNDDGHAVIAEIVLAALDDREPRISGELLSVPPDPVTVLGSQQPADDDGIPVFVFVIALMGAFVAGSAVTLVFFYVRDR